MKKDLIQAFIIFIVILAGGIGLFYVSQSTSTGTTPTPTPQQSNQVPPQATTKTPAQDASDLARIHIVDEKIGTGPAVKNGDTITVNYTGSLTNGKVFDTSVGKQPFTTQIGEGQVIRGWDLGLIGMRVGGKRKLTIPPDLAYGSSGQGAIPPNSTLIFEVNLLSIK